MAPVLLKLWIAFKMNISTLLFFIMNLYSNFTLRNSNMNGMNEKKYDSNFPFKLRVRKGNHIFWT